jgi:hypothetical protein
MSDDYAIITTKFRGLAKSGKAIFVERPKHHVRTDPLSVPRSLIHGGDDLNLERSFEGQEITFRLMKWKAEELGLA